MNLKKLLSGVECRCGKHHTCDIDAVCVEKDAALRLGELCPESRILLVADENTYAVSGAAVEKSLADKKVSRVIFDGSRLLIPNEKAIDAIRVELGDCELIVGIGSGVIQDLCKYVAHLAAIPYVIVATAPSMDGYASTGAAMILGGMKVTVPTGLPRAIVADVDVLRKAPIDMIKAGFGDIIGKYSALADWRLSNIVNGEYFCDYIYGIAADTLESVRGLGKKLLLRDGEAVKILTESLIVVGIMMSFLGNSRPASGSEHHLSHFFEIVGILRDEPYLPHGIDVAYSTVVTSEIREHLIASGFESCFEHNKDAHIRKMNEIYGTIAESCIALQEKSGLYTKDRIGIYKEREEEIRTLFTSLPGSETIKAILGSVELDIGEFYSLYGEEKIRNAVAYAKDLKDRYTVLCMNYDLNGGVWNG